MSKFSNYHRFLYALDAARTYSFLAKTIPFSCYSVSVRECLQLARELYTEYQLETPSVEYIETDETIEFHIKLAA